MKNYYTMNENTINEIKKTDIGTGVQMPKYFNHKSPASQGNDYALEDLPRKLDDKQRVVTPGTPGFESCIQRKRQLGSFRFENRLPVPEHRH